MIGSDHVDELGEAGGAHAVGVIEERDEEAADHQRILHGIHFLQNRRRDWPSGLHPGLVGAARAIPDVPFVEAQHDPLRGPALRGGGVGDGDHLLDEGVDEIGGREEGQPIVFPVVKVGVNRDVIDVIEGVLEHRSRPRSRTTAGARPEDPEAAISIELSAQRMILAARAATRPYSSGVSAPVCQGPSISLPRHQNLTPCGLSQPCVLRSSDSVVPPG